MMPKQIKKGKEILKRIKKDTEDKDKLQRVRWKPKMGERFWYIFCLIGVDSDFWNGNSDDKFYYNLGNVFKTKKEAQEKLKQIKKILKEHE